MNGNNLMIDTNIAIYLLEGNKQIAELLDQKNIFLSFITELELMSKNKLTQAERSILKSFLNSCNIFDINFPIKEKTISIKQSYKIKLPDAIIAATAIWLDIPLVSADTDMRKIKSLDLISIIL